MLFSFSIIFINFIYSEDTQSLYWIEELNCQLLSKNLVEYITTES